MGEGGTALGCPKAGRRLRLSWLVRPVRAVGVAGRWLRELSRHSQEEPRAGWRRGSQGGGRAGSVSRLSVSLICLDFHQTEAEREEKNQNSNHLWKNSIKRLSVLVKWKETISTKKNGIENIFEDIVPGNDSNLSKIAIHRSWNHANPEHYNYKKSHLRSIRAKLLKIKDKKAAGWKKERDLLHMGEE